MGKICSTFKKCQVCKSFVHKSELILKDIVLNIQKDLDITQNRNNIITPKTSHDFDSKNSLVRTASIKLCTNCSLNISDYK